VAREFEADGVPFVVIEAKHELEPELRRDGVLYLLGNSSSEDLLRAAGIEHAKGLVGAVDSDAENVYSTLVARSLNPTVSIVARASQDPAADRLYRAGVERVVLPYATTGRRTALIALRPEVVDFFDLARSVTAALRMEELLVPTNSELVGQTVQVFGRSHPPSDADLTRVRARPGAARAARTGTRAGTYTRQLGPAPTCAPGS
jgi:voltage-gated potassium channel